MIDQALTTYLPQLVKKNEILLQKFVIDNVIYVVFMMLIYRIKV